MDRPFSRILHFRRCRTAAALLLRFVPGDAQARVDHAAGKGWRSLSHYVRATILVALSDAIGILIAALILRVPVAPALAALVFIGAFVPLVGGFVSGFVAVLVALVALGWVQALIMFGAIILVMQIEGHILQPFLLGRAVKLHPLAVLLAIAIGIIVAGVVGALVAVPILAFTKSVHPIPGRGSRARRSPAPLDQQQPSPLSRVMSDRWPRRGRRAQSVKQLTGAVVRVGTRGDANAGAASRASGDHGGARSPDQDPSQPRRAGREPNHSPSLTHDAETLLRIFRRLKICAGLFGLPAQVRPASYPRARGQHGGSPPWTMELW